MGKFIPCRRGLNVKLKIWKNSRIFLNLFVVESGGDPLKFIQT